MAVKPVFVPKPSTNIFSAAWGYMSSIRSGMVHTMKIFFEQLLGKEKPVTVQWPEQPATYGERFKGKHFLTLRDDGQVRCTACFLCATNCPAQCIHIEAGQHPDNEIEKYPVRFEIDILRCVFCGYCEEACPVDAIRLGPEYVMTGGATEKWIYTKDYLVSRPELQGGVHSVKDENVKHKTINTHVGAKEYHPETPHGGAGH
ncbi:MAG: NADH-quinone oxidoreductase subunit I [Oligoflexales bacterium]